jgi:hypothetical protein
MNNLTEDIRSDLTKIFTERHEQPIQEENGLTVDSGMFLDWFFSDKDDYMWLANDILEQVKKGTNVVVKTSAQSIFNSAEYIPGNLVQGGDENREYPPDELTLV